MSSYGFSLSPLVKVLLKLLADYTTLDLQILYQLRGSFVVIGLPELTSELHI
jgi:hypothetical protein